MREVELLNTTVPRRNAIGEPSQRIQSEWLPLTCGMRACQEDAACFVCERCHKHCTCAAARAERLAEAERLGLGEVIREEDKRAVEFAKRRKSGAS